MKLSNIRSLGRYRNTKTGKEYNIKKGRWMQRGVELIFYLYRGERQFISDAIFYHEYKKVDELPVVKPPVKYVQVLVNSFEDLPKKHGEYFVFTEENGKDVFLYDANLSTTWLKNVRWYLIPENEK